MARQSKTQNAFRSWTIKFLCAAVIGVVGINLVFFFKLPCLDETVQPIVSYESTTEATTTEPNIETWGIKPEGANLFDITANQGNLFPKLRERTSNISSLILRPSDDSRPISIVPHYYQWIASQHLCDLIKGKDARDFMATILLRRYFAGDCTTNLSLSIPPNSTMHPKYVKTSFVEEVENYFPNITTYLTLLNHAFVPINATAVYSPAVVFTPVSCAVMLPSLMPSTEGAKVIDGTVFLLSQIAGETTYHSVVEGLTRMGPYLAALRKRTDVKIHVGNHPLAHFMLQKLGMDRKRLIDGPILARTLIVPEGTRCGQPRPFQTQMFYQELQRMLSKSRTSEKVRDAIVLIKRTGIRRLINYDEIKSQLEETAKQHGLKLVEFSDTNLPSFEETADIFYRSVQIVAPHGAGLVNLLFARPGTFVTEAVCGQTFVNLCYQRLAYILGFRYQGVAEKRGCPDVIDIEASEIVGYVRQNLDEWKNRAGRIFPPWKSSEQKIKWTAEKLGDQTEIDEFLSDEENWFREMQRKDLEVMKD